MLISIFLNIVISFITYNHQVDLTPESGYIFFEQVDVSPISLGVETSASNVLVINSKNNQVLYSKGAYEVRSIASITKLMTALVFLDTNPNWDSYVEFSDDDEVGGARLRVSAGEAIKVKDLFNASMTASTNNGITALVKSTGLSVEDFVVLMNKKAEELKMNQTSFREPTGLSDQNVSTAHDIAILVKTAFEKLEITTIAKASSYSFTTRAGRVLSVKNTDLLIDSFLNSEDYSLVGAKTGFITASGYCLASQIRNGENEIITVVLNSKSLSDRFLDTKALAYWTFNNKF